MKNLGSMLREKRESMNLLLRHAAAQLDIDQAVLSKIERNERKATKEQLANFSQFYNLDLNDISIIWNSERILDLLSGENNLEQILNNLLERIK